MIVDPNKFVPGYLRQIFYHACLAGRSRALNENGKPSGRCCSDKVEQVVLNERSEDIIRLFLDRLRALWHPVMLERDVIFAIAWEFWCPAQQ